MATAGAKPVDCKLARVGSLNLEDDSCNYPEYTGVVVLPGDMVMVVDSDAYNTNAFKLRLCSCHDGKLLATSEGLQVQPHDVCVFDEKETQVAMTRLDGKIEILSFKYPGRSAAIRKIRILDATAEFEYCHGVRALKSRKQLVVSGGKKDKDTQVNLICWGILSNNDGHVHAVHKICKSGGGCYASSSYLATSADDRMVFISCWTGTHHPNNNGVYAFDVMNGKRKFVYHHKDLASPKGISVDREGFIYVCNWDPSCIHQLTVRGEPVTIHVRGMPPEPLAMYWKESQKELYVTSRGSKEVWRLNRMLNGQQEDHTAPEVLVSDERKQPVTEKTSAVKEQGVFGKGQSNVKTEMPPSESSPEDSEGGKQVDQKASEVPLSYERKQPDFEETSSQIVQEVVDGGQANVKMKMPPSGQSPEDSEVGKQGHKASEVPLTDERKQPVFEETSSQIVQEIPIQQRVGEALNQAGIQMSTEDQDMFIKFQREIGTTLFFSTDPESLKDAQKDLDTTELFLKNNIPNVVGQWLEYRDQGKLTFELIDKIYAQNRNLELHDDKDYFLNKMEQLNIISRARSFSENGVKEENYFFTPCVLRKKSPRELIAPDKDPCMVSTSVLCWVITGKCMMPGIFQKLIAACVAHWPVAKKKELSENLIFQDCTVFDLDPTHRLLLHCENHAVYARISRMGIDDINGKICTRVRKLISMNLTEIISHQDPNLKYKLCVQNDKSQDIPEDIGSHFSPPCEMWFMDEVHDPDAPITREHTNHARLCVALVTVCRNAMITILCANIPASHTNIYQAILANKTKLISRTQSRSGKWQNALLNKDQCKMLFPDSKCRYMASIDQLDISLLYGLIRNVSVVNPPSTGWGVAPQDNPRDKSLGANVERIHFYRNVICGHSVDGQISQHDFDYYWYKIDCVLCDIDAVIGGQAFSQELEVQKRQVISVYEA